MAQAILRSRTALAFFGSLSAKKRDDWVRNLAYDLEAEGMREVPKVFRESVLAELCQQPYAGSYLFFLIFEDFSDNTALMTKAYSNTTDYDFVQYLAS
jgi:hypothetical protein